MNLEDKILEVCRRLYTRVQECPNGQPCSQCEDDIKAIDEFKNLILTVYKSKELSHGRVLHPSRLTSSNQ